MKSLNQTFEVAYQYQVFFSENIFDLQNPVLSDFFATTGDDGFQRKALVVIDNGLLGHYPALSMRIRDYFETNLDNIQLTGLVQVAGGEACKNNQVDLDKIIDAVDSFGIDRHSYLIAIGGGAVLDMAGFAATISHRGVRHVRIPTTVLSQNDSGVGVKNSINYRGKKNFLGTFAPPAAVFNDRAFLETLDDRDWRGGISEAIKVALIKDRVFFEWIEKNADELASRSMQVMDELIYRCAELHVAHIRSGDPFEKGSSRPLDFGHWAAHKLEYLTDFEIRHGEAVAIGIALDSIYSFLQKRIAEEELQRILKVFETLGFDLYHPLLAENDAYNLKAGLQEFREHLGGQLTIMLLESIGKGAEVHEMDEVVISEAVDFLKERTFGVNSKPVALT